MASTTFVLLRVCVLRPRFGHSKGNVKVIWWPVSKNEIRHLYDQIFGFFRESQEVVGSRNGLSISFEEY